MFKKRTHVLELSEDEWSEATGRIVYDFADKFFTQNPALDESEADHHRFKTEVYNAISNFLKMKSAEVKAENNRRARLLSFVSAAWRNQSSS